MHLCGIRILPEQPGTWPQIQWEEKAKVAKKVNCRTLDVFIYGWLGPVWLSQNSECSCVVASFVSGLDFWFLCVQRII